MNNKYKMGQYDNAFNVIDKYVDKMITSLGTDKYYDSNEIKVSLNFIKEIISMTRKEKMEDSPSSFGSSNVIGYLDEDPSIN